MLADVIQAGFPLGVTVPEDLRRLCDFADEHEGQIGGCLEFDTDGREAVLAWFGGDEAAAAQFGVFGRGPDGSLYALWLYEGREAHKAPVVLLDSESANNKVVANDLRDFLRLLACGYDEPGRYPELEPEDPDSAAELREWLREEFGLTAPASAEALVAEAQSQHPDFAAWVREWQERRNA